MINIWKLMLLFNHYVGLGILGSLFTHKIVLQCDKYSNNGRADGRADTVICWGRLAPNNTVFCFLWYTLKVWVAPCGTPKGVTGRRRAVSRIQRLQINFFSIFRRETTSTNKFFRLFECQFLSYLAKSLSPLGTIDKIQTFTDLFFRFSSNSSEILFWTT